MRFRKIRGQAVNADDQNHFPDNTVPKKRFVTYPQVIGILGILPAS